MRLRLALKRLASAVSIPSVATIPFKTLELRTRRAEPVRICCLVFPCPLCDPDRRGLSVRIPKTVNFAFPCEPRPSLIRSDLSDTRYGWREVACN